MNKSIQFPFTIILYGLSGSGKSTLAKGIYNYLVDNNVRSELMDADDYRKVLSPNEPFDEFNRNLFRKKLFFIANLLNKHNVCAVIPMIASDSRIRQFAREKINNLYEIYIKASIDICINRNPKGLYTKVNGEFKKNIIGIDIPFIEPSNPHLIIDSGKINQKESLRIIIESLKQDINFISSK